jgi:predicted nicotinamide N-methyase
MTRTDDRVLDTTGGKFPLYDYRLCQGDHEWTVLHAGAVLTEKDETHAIVLKTNRLPYGVSLWPSGIALAHEIANRAKDFESRTVLELGAGIGLPGIVAASLGASRVVQTDQDELVLHLCQRNGERNQVRQVEYQVANWTAWTDSQQYDWIIGSDILYGDTFHPNLRKIFETNLSAGGRILVADPFRALGFRFLESLEADGWGVSLSKWNIGEDATSRPIGVFEVLAPRSHATARRPESGLIPGRSSQ